MKKPEKVALIIANCPMYEQYCPNFLGMEQGLRDLGIEYKAFTCRPTLDVGSVVAYQPDLVIYTLLDMVKHREWRMEIRKGLPEARIVMWYGDLRNDETGQIKADMSEIDMMFVSNDAQEEFYKDKWKVKECHFLPLGSPIFKPPLNKKYQLFDFVFLGSQITGAAFLDRAKIMWRYRDRGLKIINGANSDMRAKVFKEMPSIYRSAKICLDYSHFTDIEGYTSNRFWIIPASGGFALTKRWPGCEKFYPEGTRVYFDTFEESLALRDYYLEHEEKRKKIQSTGYAHARNHTYDKRYPIMFEKLYG